MEAAGLAGDALADDRVFLSTRMLMRALGPAVVRADQLREVRGEAVIRLIQVAAVPGEGEVAAEREEDDAEKHPFQFVSGFSQDEKQSGG